MRSLLIFILLLLPALAFAEYQTIDELANAYGDETCKACHAQIYEAWQASRHSTSVVSSIGITRQFLASLEKDWKKPLNREHMMRCVACHAPQLKDASESLILEVGRLIVTAFEDKDEKKRAEAEKVLSRLNVNCVVCHNTKIAVEKNLRGEPKKGVFYGPTGKPSPAHGVEKSPAIRSSLFCGQCHMIHTPPDGEIVFCSSLYESYQDSYRARGGTKTCQDCHMTAKNGGHRMPGGHDVETVRDALDLEVDAIGVKLYPGRWVPTAVVNIGITNRAGHRTPDG
jgi:hypothetical protein